MKIQLHPSTIFFLRNINVITSPTKKRVGRPTKLYISDQVKDMIAKYYNSHEMVDFSKIYDQLFGIH